MSTETYRIFVSSRMEEFKSERLRIKDALNNFFSIFVYEEDAGARSKSIQETYTEELINCDLYIGIFGLGFGEYTLDEFRKARKQKIDCFIYEKEISGNEQRDLKLVHFLKEISEVENKGGLTPSRFKNIEDLIIKIERDVGRWVKSKGNIQKGFYQKPKLDPGKRYYCDRETQFLDLRLKDENKKFNFFIIDGEKKQSHASLVRRFSIDKTAIDHVKIPIAIDDKGNIARLKIFIQMQLFEKFGISPLPKDLSIKTFAESISNEVYQQVFIIFRIEEDLLSNKNITDAVSWFSREYCNEKSLPAGSPNFYFFLIIRYNETGSSKKKSIQKLLTNFKEYIKLDELDNVGPEHLRKWVEDHGIAETETSQEMIVQHYFKENTYPMELAEMQIAKLILDYNNENPELKNLINKY